MWGSLAASAAALQDPFAPGLRSSASADAAHPSLPRGVAFGAGGNLLWVANNGANPHLDLFSVHPLGTNPVEERDDGVATSSGGLFVAAGRDDEAFFAVAQYPAPDALHRATRVTRHDPLSAAAGAAFQPVWTYDTGLITNGAARIACDEAGGRVVVAVWNNATSQVQLDWLDAVNGVRTARAVVAGAGLSDLVLSADGERAAFSAGLDLWVVDANANVLAHRTLASSTPAIALSGDGALLVAGGIGHLTVFADQGAGYVPDFDVVAPQNELSSRTALSSDGRTLAIGWWNFSKGIDIRLEVWDVPTRVRLFEIVQHGISGGLQNMVEAVRCTPDGQRVAFGCWGDGTSKPDVILLDRGSVQPLLQINLAGSVQGLALDRSGTRVAVAHKDAHANQFATTGKVRIYDTGERDLQILKQPHVGGTLELAAKHPGTTTVFFLAGPANPFPNRIPGTVGTLFLKRNQLTISAVQADAQGRADLSLPIANDPSLIGTTLEMQAAFRAGGPLVFGAVLLEPLML